MQFIWQHIASIIEEYDGALPLTHFLKLYFKRFPRLGSRDRKILSAMAYSWYRCSRGLAEDLGFERRLQACLYLCEAELPQIGRFLPEEWLNTGLSVEERVAWLRETQEIRFERSDLMRSQILLSEGIDRDEWLFSMLRQPRLFIRVVKDWDRVLDRLKEAEIAYRNVSHRLPGGAEILSLSLLNGIKLEDILDANTYVVQDLSSQKTFGYFSIQQDLRWWDCCAGAGGKSLLLSSLDSKVKLVASDLRATVLKNLQTRFRQYGLKVPDIRRLDVSELSLTKEAMGDGELFDRIICDAPCSGSGTWARTPEQLYFSDQDQLNRFPILQRQIAINALQFLRPGGMLIYITCSVFRQENEEMTAYLTQLPGIRLQNAVLINGIKEGADSMYIAVFNKGENGDC